MEKYKEYVTVCAVGAAGYSLIEVLWRGFTHWTMALAGGAGFLLLYLTDLHMSGKALLHRCTAGCAVLTFVEFTVGCVVNRLFHMGVWDYSRMRGNLLGQVCPLYCLLWFLLCIPAMALSRGMRVRLRPTAGGEIVL